MNRVYAREKGYLEDCLREFIASNANVRVIDELFGSKTIHMSYGDIKIENRVDINYLDILGEKEAISKQANKMLTMITKERMNE